MEELSNCPNCGELFVRNNHRDLCQKCWKKEEVSFETVYKFIRQRENRTATIHQVEEGTGVDEELILKFIKTGRLKVASLPNLGYPCEKCGTTIQKGKLCEPCADILRKELDRYSIEEERRRELDKKATYFAANNKFRN